MTILAWLESTDVARTVSGSLSLTASLSAAHLIGFTVVSGGAFVMHLRLAGAMLRRTSVLDVARPAGRLIALGLTVSAVTGALLFAGRASEIAANGIFQTKMSLIVVAVAWQLVVQRRLTQTVRSGETTRALGIIGLALWLGLAVTACAFILLE
jgi:uncharacterized protein DUF6644